MNTAREPPRRRAITRAHKLAGKIQSNGQTKRIAISAMSGARATSNALVTMASAPSSRRDQCKRHRLAVAVL